MSNETFEHLYKKFENMIRVFIKKYKGLLEEEDIRQCCCLAIVKSHKTYKDNRNTKFSNWVYNNMNWECLRQLRSIKHQDRNCVSLQTVLNTSEDDNMTLEDTLQDDNVNIQEEIEDKLMIQTYKNEIIRCLDLKKADVMILKYFECMPNNYIEKVLNITGVSNYIRESRMTLIRKSLLFRNEYRRIHHIDDYSNTERLALI